MKRKTPKEIIESGNPKTEQAYIKFPLKEPIKISEEENEKEAEVSYDLSRYKISKKFHKVHTHVHKSEYKKRALPSSHDLFSIFNNKEKNSHYGGK